MGSFQKWIIGERPNADRMCGKCRGYGKISSPIMPKTTCPKCKGEGIIKKKTTAPPQRKESMRLEPTSGTELRLLIEQYCQRFNQTYRHYSVHGILVFEDSEGYMTYLTPEKLQEKMNPIGENNR